MSILSQEMVRLQATALNKQDAILQAGELLVKNGYVGQVYVDGMLAREQVMSTYLGNGIAIPHGKYEDLHEVHRTGISVVQIPGGIEWEEGERAYLVIGIAATAEEHLGVLANLAEVVEDLDTIQQLAQTTDPMVIVERLSRAPAPLE